MNKPNGERCRGWDCQPLPAGACACADCRARGDGLHLSSSFPCRRGAKFDSKNVPSSELNKPQPTENRVALKEPNKSTVAQGSVTGIESASSEELQSGYGISKGSVGFFIPFSLAAEKTSN